MYLKWHQQTISDFSDENINVLYDQGYLFGRIARGVMDQTRSLRIDLSKFELNSENRRILRKTENITIQKSSLPYSEYHWSIGKLAKDFYDTKFGDGTFSANKVKEIMTDKEKSNFNCLLLYTYPYETSPSLLLSGEQDYGTAGYCIAKETDELLHYCYPFYKLAMSNEQLTSETPQQATSYQLPPNTGLGMMLKAIVWAKENGKKYVYLGSFSRPTDTYKLQFGGLEWWDKTEWKTDLDELKKYV